jgi:hypothetical protein
MPGGLMILVAYGLENVYLTDNPQITFFKIVYRRHTNFSIEPIPQFFNIEPNFSNRVSTIISKNGDLINRIYIIIQLPIVSNLPQDIISNIFSYVPKDKDMSSPTADMMKQVRINLFYDINNGTNYTDEEALTFAEDEDEKLWGSKYLQFYKRVREEHQLYNDNESDYDSDDN